MRRSILLREHRRKILQNRNFSIKKLNFCYKGLNKKNYIDLFENLKLNFQYQRLNRNLFNTRNKNRCFLTGRARGFYRFFGLSRHSIKNLFSLNLLSGLRKSSW